MGTPKTPPGLLLANCPMLVQHGNAARSHPCKVFFDLNRNNSLLIEVLEPVESTAFVDDTFLLSLSGVDKPIACHKVSWTLGMRQGQARVSVKLMPRMSKIEIDHATPLVRVNAGIVNLGHYWFKGPRCTSVTLRHGDWKFEFLPVTERTVLYLPPIQSEDYFFTHHLVIRKENNTTFSCLEAHQELALLCTFLSFCQGHWVSTALTYGLDEHGAVAMEEWGTRKLSPSHGITNWLDEHHGNCMEILFPGFVQRMTNSDWRDALKHAIYWYVRSDTGLVGPDGACVLLQAALERLAWHVLVQDRRSISEDGFSKLPAADQLRLLLSTLEIPLTLPSEMTDLQKIAKESNWMDGPQAFVEIRNRIVHPPKKRRTNKELPYFDAYRLAKWYVELIILSACGYSGVYANRTLQQRWVGQVELVPWASST